MSISFFFISAKSLTVSRCLLFDLKEKKQELRFSLKKKFHSFFFTIEIDKQKRAELFLLLDSKIISDSIVFFVFQAHNSIRMTDETCFLLMTIDQSDRKETFLLSDNSNRDEMLSSTLNLIQLISFRQSVLRNRLRHDQIFKLFSFSAKSLQNSSNRFSFEKQNFCRKNKFPFIIVVFHAIDGATKKNK